MPTFQASGCFLASAAGRRPPPPSLFRSRTAAALEIFLGFVLIEAAIWDGGHIVPWAWLALGWIAASTLTAGFAFRELGLAERNFRPALWVAGAGLMLAAGIIAGGALAGTLHLYGNHGHPALGGVLYLAWALAQELILQSFFFLRFERILNSGKKAVWAAGLLFFLAHVPNPVLLIAAAITGPLLCELFRRYRNLYPLAIAHGLVGLALAAAIPDSIHHQMKVGLAYFHWH